MEKKDFEIIQISETSALIDFGNIISEEINKKIRTLCRCLEEKYINGFIEYIPYFSGVSVIYDPLKIDEEEPFEFIKENLEKILLNLDFSDDYEEHIIKIPVCYGGEYGPDIKFVAETNNIDIKDVIDIHSKGRYLVYMIGFAPGFPYLGGMSEKIYAPRRKTPRTSIPKGAVGIAGMQTGVYPIETPGGWQIIGRTPLKLFDLNRDNPALLKCGDVVKFYPISYDEYMKLEGEE